MAAAAEKPPVIMPKASLEERAIEVRNAREPGTAMTLLRELMQRPAPAPPRDTLWVTVAEASAESGLSETLLHRLIAKELLPAIKDRGWKVRRADLANIDSGLVSLLSCGTMICGSVS
jgi:hypothetical protein